MTKYFCLHFAIAVNLITIKIQLSPVFFSRSKGDRAQSDAVKFVQESRSSQLCRDVNLHLLSIFLLHIFLQQFAVKTKRRLSSNLGLRLKTNMLPSSTEINICLFNHGITLGLININYVCVYL